MGDASRAILHVDMDAFFAAVETLDNPELAGRPVIVGGSGRRGVVASCSYEARAFGVRSAMPSVRARRLCPDAVFVDGHYSRYAEVSGRFHQVLESVTPFVEPVGLDEAFLDVTGSLRLLGTSEEIAVIIRDRVHAELSLTCSVGGGSSKLVAKLASRKAKPVASRAGLRPGRGVVVIDPDRELEFLHPMAVEAVWGVGPSTARRLHDLGVRTVGELAHLPVGILERRLGKAHGAHLAALARGHDPDPVVPGRSAKSLGHEETFGDDVTDAAELDRHALRMAESVALHLREAGLVGRTVTVKVKFADFSLTSRSHTLPVPVDTARAVSGVARALLESVDPGGGVRLLGISVSGLGARTEARQLTFAVDGAVADPAAGEAGDIAGAADEARRAQEAWEDVSRAIDTVRARFGRSSLGTAAMVGDAGVVVPTRRESPWGPAASTGGDGGGSLPAG
jgi:DNA polymerase-4